LRVILKVVFQSGVRNASVPWDESLSRGLPLSRFAQRPGRSNSGAPHAFTPLLRPRYAARLEVSVVQDSGLSEDLGIIYPDVEGVTASPSAQTTPELSAAFTPATLTLPPPIKIRIPTVEVRDIKANRLVTCIGIADWRDEFVRGGVYPPTKSSPPPISNPKKNS
jgi:hypothetical protein